mmetsp:Transcript_119509/g.283734  ORF Transcript_119509/g.283734 Transcript_119509/m.283734 type:complete len:390 (+) Transcript_119509:280-1449(+)
MIRGGLPLPRDERRHLLCKPLVDQRAHGCLNILCAVAARSGGCLLLEPVDVGGQALRGLREVLEAAGAGQIGPGLQAGGGLAGAAYGQAPHEAGDDGELEEALEVRHRLVVGLDLVNECLLVLVAVAGALRDAKKADAFDVGRHSGISDEGVRQNLNLHGIMDQESAHPLIDAPQPREVVPGCEHNHPIREGDKLLQQIHAEGHEGWVGLRDAGLVDPEAHAAPEVWIFKELARQLLGVAAHLRSLRLRVAGVHAVAPASWRAPTVGHEDNLPVHVPRKRHRLRGVEPVLGQGVAHFTAGLAVPKASDLWPGVERRPGRRHVLGEDPPKQHGRQAQAVAAGHSIHQLRGAAGARLLIDIHNVLDLFLLVLHNSLNFCWHAWRMNDDDFL